MTTTHYKICAIVVNTVQKIQMPQCEIGYIQALCSIYDIRALCGYSLALSCSARTSDEKDLYRLMDFKLNYYVAASEKRYIPSERNRYRIQPLHDISDVQINDSSFLPPLY